MTDVFKFDGETPWVTCIEKGFSAPLHVCWRNGKTQHRCRENATGASIPIQCNPTGRETETGGEIGAWQQREMGRNPNESAHLSGHQPIDAHGTRHLLLDICTLLPVCECNPQKSEDFFSGRMATLFTWESHCIGV